MPGIAFLAPLAFSRPTLSVLPWWNMQLVALVTGKSFVDANDFDGLIYIGGSEIADCAWHIEYELPNAFRCCKSLGGNKHFPRKQAVQEVIVKLGFIHVVDVRSRAVCSPLRAFGSPMPPPPGVN